MEIQIDYTPRDANIDRFHDRTERVCNWIAHRRRGKTVAIANDGPRRLIQIPIKGREHAPPKIAWMYPTRVRAKDIAWSYLKYYTRKIPGIKQIESELSVEFADGRRFTLYGADGHRGVGQYLDGIYYDERDDIPDKVVVDLAPTLTDYQGFEVHAGMLRGRYRLWKLREKSLGDPSVLNMIERASETGVIPPDELVVLKAKMGDSEYDMQMECNPNAAIANAIYGTEMDGLRKADRIKSVATDPAVSLDFFFDIGHSLSGDDWACWALQFSGRDVLALESFANTGKLPAFYAAKMREICEARKAGLGWVYLPHDGSRTDRSGKSAEDDLRAAGITRIKIIPRTPHIWDGINALRARLPRFYINFEGCSQGWTLGDMEMPSGIDALDFYTKKQDVTTGLISDVPVHNQFSHLADALRTYAEADKQGLLEGTAETTRHYEPLETRYKVTREPLERQRKQYSVSR